MIIWIDAQLPPQILWVTCGNTTNENLKRILLTTMPMAKVLLEGGEAIVEIQAA
jgi:predicted nuclease of predicted toxin-antitoxin system